MVHAGAIELNRDGVEEKSEKGKRSLEADVASPLSLSLSSIHRGRVKRPPLPSPSPPYIPDKFILIFLSRGGRRFYGFHAWTPFAHASTRRSSPSPPFFFFLFFFFLFFFASPRCISNNRRRRISRGSTADARMNARTVSRKRALLGRKPKR